MPNKAENQYTVYTTDKEYAKKLVAESTFPGVTIATCKALFGALKSEVLVDPHGNARVFEPSPDTDVESNVDMLEGLYVAGVHRKSGVFRYFVACEAVDFKPGDRIALKDREGNTVKSGKIVKLEQIKDPQAEEEVHTGTEFLLYR